MINAQHIFVFAALVFVFGVVSRLTARIALTGPIVFVACGLALAPQVARWLGGEGGFFDLGHAEGLIHLLGEITLVVVLFTDATQIRLRSLLRSAALPARMLLIGMPLTVGLGTALAWLLFGELGVWAAALLATILAPTDAALGQAVVVNRRVPLRIRQALSVESGLNDGLAVPLMLFFACLASAGHAEHAVGLGFAAKQVVLGPLLGLLAGGVGVWLMGAASRRGWMEESFQAVSGIALAVVAYAVAHAVGGNGFIAAFVAGLVVGNHGGVFSENLYDFAEAESQLLVLSTFFLVGLTLMWEPLLSAGWRVWVYAGLSLTVVRMLPVAVAVWGLGLRPKTVWFIGWFGPRGLASVLFAVLVIEDLMVPQTPQITQVVLVTVLLSVVAHGVTAAPWAAWYGRAVERDGRVSFETGRCPHEPVRKRCLRTPPTDEGLSGGG